MQKFRKIIPYLFENYLIVAMEASWIERFNKMPTFDVYVDDSQRLHLVSQEVIQNASGTTKQ